MRAIPVDVASASDTSLLTLIVVHRLLFFFFSSRRRHTRSKRDWSSDVCSSDLTMKFDKTIPGWGKGDTERACDIKAGNCTDFHSLFISLARAKGIPARFVIGFPLTAKDGMVKGYHCWAEFWLAGKGWIPVDASEASKSSDPKVRAFLFGNLDADRVQFTMGRDLVLKPKTSEPLNYFIYPHAEVGGQPVGAPAIALQFEEVKATAAALAPAALPSSSR